ncbi:meiotic sister chromatid cohesion, centromeric [Tyrophagus putrescentiae]|nr:meiotic sister chromatid cohesion, centromeric [Tyrophagus putrescentiae]
MEQIELTKENVQPLKCGRKIESLRAALSMDLNETRRRDETKAEFEAKLASTTDDDEKLDVYVNYVRWIEQNYPEGEKTLKPTLKECILYYKQKADQYKDQDRPKPSFKDSEKLLSIFLKYISFSEHPLQLQLFKIFCKEGFFRQFAQFYVTFAYSYEMAGETRKAVDALKKGLQERAEPQSELTSALADLQVRTVRQMVAHPEAMEQQSASKSNRKALTGLKAKVDRHGVAEAPVRRVGHAALASNGGGLRAAATVPGNPPPSSTSKSNEQLRILSDENLIIEAPVPPVPRTPLATSSISSRSSSSSSLAPAEGVAVPPPPVPLVKDNKENEREPGKWSENKLNIKGMRKRAPLSSTSSSSATPAFAILEDNNAPRRRRAVVLGEQSFYQSTKPPPPTAAAEKPIAVAKFEDEEAMSNTDGATTMVTHGATSIVRDFYNGTLNSSSFNESAGAGLTNATLQQTMAEAGEAKITTTATRNASPPAALHKSFAIFSETMMAANAAAVEAYESPDSTAPNLDIEQGQNEVNNQQQQQQHQLQESTMMEVGDENNGIGNGNEVTFATMTTTTMTFKEDDLLRRSGASSTPCAERGAAAAAAGASFKRPTNMTVTRLQSHPNFVTGITAKLSPIIETSREYNKSSSTSSASSSSGSSTGSKSGCYSAYSSSSVSLGFGLSQQLFSENTFHQQQQPQQQQQFQQQPPPPPPKLSPLTVSTVAAETETKKEKEENFERLTLASLDLPRTPAASGLARSARETLVGGRSCEARPRRFSHALLNIFDNLTGGSPWPHLGDRQRPPPRTLLAPLARPSATGVGSRPSEARPRRLVPCTVTLHLCLGQRLTLTSLGQCARPEAADVAHCPSDVRPRRTVLGTAPPHHSALPAAQGCGETNQKSENSKENVSNFSGFLVNHKRPTNMTVTRLQSHPNFVTGITAKLSPIIETSREYNKSSSTSSASSSSGSSTGSKIISHHQRHQQKNRAELLATLSDSAAFYAGYEHGGGLDFIEQMEAILYEPLTNPGYFEQHDCHHRRLNHHYPADA